MTLCVLHRRLVETVGKLPAACCFDLTIWRSAGGYAATAAGRDFTGKQVFTDATGVSSRLAPIFSSVPVKAGSTVLSYRLHSVQHLPAPALRLIS